MDSRAQIIDLEALRECRDGASRMAKYYGDRAAKCQGENAAMAAAGLRPLHSESGVQWDRDQQAMAQRHVAALEAAIAALSPAEPAKAAPALAPGMGLAEFHARLRLLHNLDFRDLVQAGVIDDDEGGEADWKSFRQDPARFFIRVDDETAGKLWALCEQRAAPRRAA